MQKAEVCHLLGSVVEPVPDDDCRHGIDVEFRYSLAESGGFQISSLHYDHLFFREELENLADLSLDHSRSVLVGVEGSSKELVQAFLSLRVACGDGREDMGSQDLLNGEFSPEFL